MTFYSCFYITSAEKSKLTVSQSDMFCNVLYEANGDSGICVLVVNWGSKPGKLSETWKGRARLKPCSSMRHHPPIVSTIESTIACI
jgi:hypothetical protein